MLKPEAKVTGVTSRPVIDGQVSHEVMRKEKISDYEVTNKVA